MRRACSTIPTVGSELYSSLHFKCHRCAKEKATVQNPSKRQIHSKKDAQCLYAGTWAFKDDLDSTYIVEHCGHMGHTPGDSEDQLNVIMCTDLEDRIMEVSIIP